MGVRHWWRTHRGEGWAVRERIGKVRSCLTLVPVEGTIDSYPLYCAAYNASCKCCGYGRWHCVTASYSRTTRAGSLDSLSLEGCRMLRLVGSIDEVPKVSGTVLDSGGYIAAVVGATVSTVVVGVIIGIIKYSRWNVRQAVGLRRLVRRIRIGCGAARGCTKDGVFVII